MQRTRIRPEAEPTDVMLKQISEPSWPLRQTSSCLKIDSVIDLNSGREHNEIRGH